MNGENTAQKEREGVRCEDILIDDINSYNGNLVLNE